MDEASNAFGVFSPPGSKTHPQFIRFVDSRCRELFKIPDGASVKIAYPPGDGRGEIVRACKYIDDCHFLIGSEALHIDQFAGIMARAGARYEPEAQIRDAGVVPFAPGEEKYCAYNREEGNACAGHISGEFGQSGDRFFSAWYNHKTKSEADWAGVAPEWPAEIHSAMYLFRRDILQDHASMAAYCKSHPEAKLPGRDGLGHYGFKLDTGGRAYFLLCMAAETSRDSRFIVYAYEKPAPMLEHGKPGAGKPAAGAPKPKTGTRTLAGKMRDAAQAKAPEPGGEASPAQKRARGGKQER